MRATEKGGATRGQKLAFGTLLTLVVMSPSCTWLSNRSNVDEQIVPTATPLLASVADSQTPTPVPTATLPATKAAQLSTPAAMTPTSTRTSTSKVIASVTVTPTSSKASVESAKTLSPTATPARPSATPSLTLSPVRTTVTSEARTLVVKVSMIGADRREVPAPDAVVWIPKSIRSESKRAPAKISSREKKFDPRITVVQVGGAVDFPNFDPINHNVFSMSEAATFDLGLYRNGTSKRQEFEKAGVVPVFCNIHPQMSAYVVVVDGAIHARTGADGTARLEGVSPGKHPVRIWQEKAREWTGEATVSMDTTSSTLSVVLDASSWRDVAHKRKDGTDYPPPDDDENRY